MTTKRTATAMRAFAQGFASAFDIGLRAQRPPLRRLKPSSADADGRAIESDWQRVGLDLRSAAERIKSEQVEADEQKASEPSR